MHRVCRVQTRESRLPCLLAFGPLLAENAAQALVPLRVITNESDATRWLAPRVEDGLKGDDAEELAHVGRQVQNQLRLGTVEEVEQRSVGVGSERVQQRLAPRSRARQLLLPQAWWSTKTVHIAKDLRERVCAHC